MREFAIRYTDAWCSHDPARVAGFFSPEGSLAINDSAPAVGRAAIAESARDFMVAFPDLRVAFDDLRIDGDVIEYHWTLTGTHAGTARKVRISGFEKWTMSPDGLIAKSQGHFDAAEYARQIEPRP